MINRKFIFSGFNGCSNHSCVVHGNRTGMGTNGACHCVQHATPSQLNILSQRLDHAINIYEETIAELVEALDSIGQRFVSGNDVPVSRASVPAEEWVAIDALITRAKEYLK